MNSAYHVLNGDCLKEMFPKSIQGELIVARECLVVGDVGGDKLDDLLETRAKFICSTYPEISKEDYQQGTSLELKRMLEVGQEDELNLWFEDDLFCQVNFWFCMNLLYENGKHENVFLVRPNKGNEYNFGRMTEEELKIAHENKISIEEASLKKLAGLWRHYQKQEWTSMQKLGKELQEHFPFVLPAVNAQIDRLSKAGFEGRPKESLKKIINDLQTSDFAPVFKEFCKREEIYGFGDFQVRTLLNEILEGQ